MQAPVIGRRRIEGTDPAAFEPGDYGKWKGGWFCSTPNGYIGGLAHHQIEEHEDGTISVTPSILVSDGKESRWHGFLERGVWRAV